ncbi:PepSY domain-containing protein [Aurantiacibacter sediminis]|uniref:PepSY domain-containing protein n=1 Tax=Aurantiacibacter sediminis TaxID=2793064 RepID=A0ABS0N316_9SPHN|nr:PepSY domain-containing protein [Aurantiacibacter sediminis]MBH5322337.1 PepSY domain-containing protein [Aurantiacibacter sediminis]
MNRAFLTKLHLVAAAFMFPAVLMFLVTGALYTWGNKGAWYESSQTVALEQPYAELDEAGLRATALEALAAADLPEPSGSSSVSGEGAEQTFSWTGARSDLSVSAGADPMSAEVALNEASVHRWLVQLHKAKGSVWFKVYATALALVLFLLVASGVVMGMQVKALRRLTVISSTVGAVAFVGFVLLG